jgi:hypothetical protein
LTTHHELPILINKIRVSKALESVCLFRTHFLFWKRF